MMRWYASDSALTVASLPETLRKAYRAVATSGTEDAAFDASGSVCLLASDVLDGADVPQWIDAGTRFLVLLDVPVGAAMRLPTLLRLRKPDQRLFLTDDVGSIRRWVVAPHRRYPHEGIVGAYVFGGVLTLFLGDLSIRDFPVERIPSLRALDAEALGSFRIDEDGSFLTWPGTDIHLGPSQLLQAVDPSSLADVEIERFRSENTAAALKHMREQRRLRQADIQGLSERQISRLENAESRLTADAAEKWASALDLSLVDFLGELGRLLSSWRERSEEEAPQEHVF